MRKWIVLLLLITFSGCKSYKPDSISVGFVHERVRSTGDDWKGYSVTATWELGKK